MDTPAVTIAERFCEHVARQLQPTQLRQLLFTVRLSASVDADRSCFVDRMNKISRSSHMPAPCPDALIATAIADPSVRDRARAFLRSAATADPVDTVQDAEMILWLMHERLERILRTSPEPPA